jgi:tripartite-type tricarboxylate transporter receptor subunit TctC
VKKLQAAAVETMNTPSVSDALKKMGTTVVAPERRSREYLKQFLDSEIAKWGVVIKASGVTLD